jgi:hypothetical protein
MHGSEFVGEAEIDVIPEPGLAGLEGMEEANGCHTTKTNGSVEIS